MGHERCQVCFNFDSFCSCGRASTVEVVRLDARTPYERACDWMKLGTAPSERDFVIEALGGDPLQDGLYLCRVGCGVTVDHECGYGGWHDVTQSLDVRPELER